MGAIGLRVALRLWPLALKARHDRPATLQSRLVVALSRLTLVGHQTLTSDEVRQTALRDAIAGVESIAHELMELALDPHRVVPSRMADKSSSEFAMAMACAGEAIDHGDDTCLKSCWEWISKGFEYLDDSSEALSRGEEQDRQWLDHHRGDVAGLLVRPLWQTGSYNPSKIAWGSVRSGLKQAGEGSAVWEEYFQCRVEGAPTIFNVLPHADTRVLRRINQEYSPWWERSPEAVNGELYGWLNADREEFPEAERPFDGDSMAAEASPVIDVDRNNKISTFPNPIYDLVTNAHVLKNKLSQLRSITGLLFECMNGNRIAPALTAVIQFYHAELLKAPDEIFWGLLENYETAIREGNVAIDRREFEPTVWPLFDSFYALHRQCISCSTRAEVKPVPREQRIATGNADLHGEVKVMVGIIHTVSEALASSGLSSPAYEEYASNMIRTGHDLCLPAATETPEQAASKTIVLKTYLFGLGGTFEGLRKVFQTVSPFVKWAESLEIMPSMLQAIDRIKELFRAPDA